MSTENEQAIKPIQARQPKALTWIFLTELWERFSYWSLYSLLVLYLVHAMHMHDKTAYVIFAAFNALLYASPIIGGWVADKLLTQRNAIIQGACWLILGYSLLCLVHTEHMLMMMLGLLIWGNGLFKPNIGSQLGACYAEDDTRRQRGFTIYYMGINIGAIIGVLGCGVIAKTYGWTPAFMLIAVAMVIGLLTYCLKLKVIVNDLVVKPKISPSLKMNALWLLVGAALVLPLGLLLTNTSLANDALIVLVVCLGVYLVSVALKQEKQARNRMLLCLILTAISVVFWALYMQMGTSLTLFTQRCVDLKIGHVTLGASMISSANGFWLLLLSPIVVKIWGWLGHKKREPKTDVKFLLGLVWMTVGYVVLALSAWLLVPGEKANLSWVIGSYGLQTLGEICLSPIGLAMVTELAPKNCKSLMMGVWFLATAIASTLSGQLAKIAAVPATLHTNMHLAGIYAHAFSVDALIGAAAVMLFLLLIPVLRKLL